MKEFKEILLGNLEEGCYAVQWLKMRCGNRGEKSNLVLLRAMLLATKMLHDFKIARYQDLSGIICIGVLRLPQLGFHTQQSRCQL